MNDPTHYPVRLSEWTPGRWSCRARGHELEAVLDGGQWVGFADGVELFVAPTLDRMERKLEAWVFADGAR